MVAADVEFFIDLAFDASHVGLHTQMVLALVYGVDVATDADGDGSVEAGFSAGLTPCVMEVAGACGTFYAENTVGDELFVRRVVLGGSSIHKEVVLRVEECWEVLVDVGVDALEGAEAIEEITGDDENLFAMVVFGHDEMGW